jgi:hypothetical protein
VLNCISAAFNALRLLANLLLELNWGYEKLPGGDHSNTMVIVGNLRRLPESKIRRKRNLVPMYFVVDDDHSDDGTIPSRLDVLTLVD